MPEPDRDKTNVGSGLSLGLISPSPPHGQDTRRCRLSHLTKRRQRPVLAGSHACTGLPDRQTGTRQVEWLVARTQPAHSKIPAFPSAEATASATPRLTGAVDSGICQVTAPPLVNRQGATDPPHSRSRLRATSIRRRGSTIIMRKAPHRHPRLSRRPCRWTARPGKRARLRGSRFGLTSAFSLASREAVNRRSRVCHPPREDPSFRVPRRRSSEWPQARPRLARRHCVVDRR